MEKAINFDFIGIATALSRSRFRVPPNQREYSWEDEQVGELLQDLTNALRRPHESYFLGTIVLTNANDFLEVADGQQRLATATMILAAARDYFAESEDEMAVQSLENDYLFTIDIRSREKLPKLTLNTDDNNYFRCSVLERPKSAERKSTKATRRSHRLISAAKKQIREHFDGIKKQVGETNFSDTLVDWQQYLVNNAKIISLSVSDASNAYMMFETLNDRGLKTSQADLVKNYIFRLAGDRSAEAQTHWSSMRGAIESMGEDDLTMDYLRHACCVRFGPTRERDVMSRLETKVVNKTEALQFIHFLDEMSFTYAAIQNPDHPKWNDYDPSIRKAVREINELGVAQIRPLLLAIAFYFPQQKAAQAFIRMVAWSVRFLIVGGRGGKLDEGYSKLANAVFNKEIKSITDLSASAHEGFVPTDAQFEAEFSKARVTVARLARFYLRNLEQTARGVSEPEFAPNPDLVINLEHIMPLKPGGEWGGVNSQDFETHCKRLGNMVLLQASRNSKIGSASFEEKKECYKDSTYLLTSQVAEKTAWGTDEIEARQKILAKFAVQTWPLN